MAKFNAVGLVIVDNQSFTETPPSSSLIFARPIVFIPENIFIIPPENRANYKSN